MITISAFKWVPEFAQGQVRDLRARWALEEAGLPYKTRLLELGDQDKPDYRALQPFGQVPILEENDLVLFESGAIVLHVGERSEALLPKDAGARARAVQNFGRFRTVSTRAREAEWELGTLATDNIVRHSRRAEITTLHEVLWMRPRVPPTPPM